MDHPTPITQKGEFYPVVEIDVSGRDIDFSDKKEVETSSRAVVARLDFGLTDWLAVFAGGGLQSVEDNTGVNGELGETFQGGIRLRVFKHDLSEIGLLLRYRWVRSEDEAVEGIQNLGIESVWKVYEAGLGFSTRFPDSRFYAGGMASFLDGEWDVETTLGPAGTTRFEAHENYGIYLGADADIPGGLIAGFEVRLISETALTLRLAYPLGGTK